MPHKVPHIIIISPNSHITPHMISYPEGWNKRAGVLRTRAAETRLTGWSLLQTDIMGRSYVTNQTMIGVSRETTDPIEAYIHEDWVNGLAATDAYGLVFTLWTRDALGTRQEQLYRKTYKLHRYAFYAISEASTSWVDVAQSCLNKSNPRHSRHTPARCHNDVPKQRCPWLPLVLCA